MSLYSIIGNFSLKYNDDQDGNGWQDAGVEEFVEHNRPRWKAFADEISTEADGELLVDVTYPRVTNVCNICVFANYLARASELEPLFMIQQDNPQKRKLCRSFYPGNFVSIGRSSFDVSDLGRGAASTIKQYKTLDDPGELKHMSIDSVPLGDLVYNKAMRDTGEGTFDSFTGQLLIRMLKSNQLYYRVRRILSRRDVEAFLGHHFFYDRNGTVARTLLDSGHPTYCYKDGAGLVRRYGSLEETQTPSPRPSRELFECVLQNHKRDAMEKSEEILERRFGIRPPSVSDTTDELLTERRQELLDDLSLQQSNPTVLIMPHIFIENLRSGDGIFQDYLSWFRETIRFARDHEDTNWLVKLHPSRHRFDQNQNVPDEVASIAGEDDDAIRVLPSDFSASSLVSIVDTVATVDGTAGLEFACYGIPPVVTSTSTYTGFGFTYEPDTRREYFELLDTTESRSPLAPGERERARVMAYLDFSLLKDNTPRCTPDDETVPSSVSPEVPDSDPRDSPLYAHVQNFVEQSNRHLYPPAEVDC